MKDPLAPVDNWQPIETAPKDQRILVVMHGDVRIAEYDRQEYHNKPAPYFRSEGPFGVYRDRASQPTKWMPLPTP